MVSDESLVALMAEGNEQALSELYARHHATVYKLSFHYLQNKEDAEEMLQDVFLAVFKNAVRFRSQSSFATWVYKITVNKCLDKLRYRKAKNRLKLLTHLWGHTPELIADTSDVTEGRDDTRQLYQAIDTLGEQQKTALILTQIQGLSIKEAAAVMQTTPKSVESLTQRAKANLKKTMKK